MKTYLCFILMYEMQNNVNYLFSFKMQYLKKIIPSSQHLPKPTSF